MNDKLKLGVYYDQYDNDADEFGYGYLTIVWPDGSIQKEYDRMEPEDAKFYRDLSWTIDLAERAFRAELENLRLKEIIAELKSKHSYNTPKEIVASWPEWKKNLLGKIERL
jgi:hypothetical protein